jgi:hypothetical protein
VRRRAFSPAEELERQEDVFRSPLDVPATA